MACCSYDLFFLIFFSSCCFFVYFILYFCLFYSFLFLSYFCCCCCRFGHNYYTEGAILYQLTDIMLLFARKAFFSVLFRFIFFFAFCFQFLSYYFLAYALTACRWKFYMTDYLLSCQSIKGSVFILIYFSLYISTVNCAPLPVYY